MRTNKTLHTVALLLATAVACASPGDDYSDARDLADALRCTSYESQPEAAAPGDIGTCQLGEDQITVIVGSDGEVNGAVTVARRTLEAFDEVVPEGMSVVRGDGWAVLTDSTAAARVAQDRVGGTVS